MPLPSTQTIRKAAQDLEENDGDEDSEDVEDDEMVVEESGEPDVVSLPPKKAKEVLNNEVWIHIMSEPWMCGVIPVLWSATSVVCQYRGSAASKEEDGDYTPRYLYLN